jgi:hypothetical protein
VHVKKIIGKLFFFSKTDPKLWLWNLQLQSKRCSRLERFFKVYENYFDFKMHYVGAVNVYKAGIVTQNRNIDSRFDDVVCSRSPSCLFLTYVHLWKTICWTWYFRQGCQMA